MTIILLASGIVLVLACAAFVVYDQVTFRRAMRADLATLARVIADNNWALIALDRPDDAAKALAALEARSQIAVASFYDEAGEAFGRPYIRAGSETFRSPPKAGADGISSTPGLLAVFQPVVDRNSKRVGTLYVAYFDEAAKRLRLFILVVSVIFAGAVALVVIISSRLQRVISQPILELAHTARVVSEEKNYSVRAVKQNEDEVGFLIDRFNEMLGRIDEREKELEKVNRQLVASEQKALAATQAKSSFLASMSHELRTPLTAIIGFSEMLLSEAESAGQQQQAEDLQRINDSAKHLLGLINDILDLSKIEAQKMDLHIEPFEVATLIRDVASTMQPLVAKRGNGLKVECPAGVGAMKADLVKVRQSLFNLLSNANKFTDRGTIWLAVAREARHGADHLVFHVRDTGIGMTPEQMGRLFKAFTQADSSTARKFGGTGLGLAITKHFCEMMNGSIRVESEPGKGSTFIIELPAEVVKAKPAEHPRERKGDTTALPGAPRVLVIDDDTNVHRLIEMALKPGGYQLHFASGGAEGLRLAKELRPAVITLDVMMPEKDGWSVLTALKSDPALARIPVIMLTIVGDKDLGFALGAAEYLVKPIDWNQLSVLLKKYAGTANSANVLIVEDDAPLRELLRRTLEKENWSVTEAGNGAEALASIASRPPSVILLDLVMPVMDGFQVLAELRKRADWSRIPVIVTTAKDLSADERERLRGGTEKILEKGSYVREELVREVQKLINQFRSA